MPLFLYHMHPFLLAVLVVTVMEFLSLLGLILVRRFVCPYLKFHDGLNDAISGTVQVIGVFYGITVGLISVGVWDTYSQASSLCSMEASAIGSLYRDVSTLPEPSRTKLQTTLRTYTEGIIEKAWPIQRRDGSITKVLVPTLDEFQAELGAFEPKTDGERARYAETLRAYNHMIEQRRLRVDAVGNGLSDIMWGVILVGAAISMVVTFLFHVEDFKMHAILVGLMGGFLGIVFFMIITNDKPFVGYAGIPPTSYQIVLDVIRKG